MGSSYSKPSDERSNTATASQLEKSTGSSHLSTPHHHAADRLARIQAEANHAAGRWSASSPRSDRHQAHISQEAIKDWDSKAFESDVAKLATLTLHNADLATSLHRRQAEISNQHIYSHTIPSEAGPVTNQRSSGRCWLFATTNVIRLEVIKSLKLKEFELSQSYLSFYDKLEKSNYFLENMIELADRPLDERVVGFLKTAPTNDGGQWDMAVNLLEKYGVVPKHVFPESYSSSYSSKINWLVTLKLREYALELRELKKTAAARLARSSVPPQEQRTAVYKVLRQRKDEQMEEVYRIMAISLGSPPKPDAEFTFEYHDKDGKFHSLKATPRSFYKDYTASFDAKSMCSLVNDPRRSPDQLITIDRLGNVWGGQPVLYVNTTMSAMRDAVVKSIKAGQPVFFGCDVGKFSETKSGIMDTGLFDYELAFNIKLGLSKADRIELGESSMTHAMVITGVHINAKGEVERYRVENSWGEDNVGDKGYMVMTDRWFQEYCYQVVTKKEFMPSKLWDLFKRGVDDKTVVLPPYDPFGALA
ncbi:peptidase C1B, bleomycin hydrolase [Violaceomyces palustris]|uniref:Peptidase C1B, bleomycin hydrolase n=1 Tax=Violaceomyces palustris TaxID=1673888 RepID=A0ACD0NQI9_9BASI|nr:peptidase C1B, bleomycin hydrolase [Violaceomyces palustris]